MQWTIPSCRETKSSARVWYFLKKFSNIKVTNEKNESFASNNRSDTAALRLLQVKFWGSFLELLTTSEHLEKFQLLLLGHAYIFNPSYLTKFHRKWWRSCYRNAIRSTGGAVFKYIILGMQHIINCPISSFVAALKSITYNMQ